MHDFIATYFLFLPVYPLALIEQFSRGPMGLVAWFVVSILVAYLLVRFKQRTALKIFIAVWIMPGTIVCGAAAIAPWPLTIPYMFMVGGCTNFLSASITLVFNVILVFGFSFLKERILKKYESA